MKISIGRATTLLILSLLVVVSTTLFLATTVAQNTEPDVDPDVVRQDASTTPAPDNAILAAETGLPVEQIGKAIAFRQAFGKYAEELISRFPDQISGVWADSPSGTTVLSTRGHVRFTGKVPPGLTSMENVVLTGGGAISYGRSYTPRPVGGQGDVRPGIP